MKLFYSQGACSLAPMIVARWQGLDMTLEKANVRKPEPEFLAINPMGAVPTLVLDDGRVFTQVSAILLYMARLNPGTDLMGRDIDEKFELDRMLSFLAADYHTAFSGYYRPRRYTTDREEPALAAVRSAWENRIGKVNAVLDGQIGGSEYMALGRLTIADAFAFAMVRWVRGIGDGLAPFPNLERFMASLGTDAGVVQALEAEKS